MYSLLVVDDEYQTRRGLCELFDWEAMNITVAADASDGDEALLLVEELKPDILLTDVRMHRMDGLELARKARELLPGIGIVFISGYSDAEYLRDALHVGASDYIYKPIRLEELESTMRRLVAKLDQQAETRLLLEKSKPLLAERFLRSWFHGLLDDKQAIRSKLDLLGMHFPEEGELFGLAFAPEWETFPENGEAENGQILLEKIIRSGISPILTCAEDTGVLAIVSASACESAVSFEEQLAQITRKAEETLHVPVIIGVSRKYTDWLDVPVAIQQAMQTITRQVLPADSNIFYFEEEPAILRSNLTPLDNDFLERYALSGNTEMMLQMVDDMLKDAAQNAPLSRKLMMSVMLRIDLVLQHQGVDALDSLAFCRQAMSYQSVWAMKNALTAMLRQACAAVEARREQTYSPAVERVMELIRTQYAEHLSVNGIAEQVHYSPAHLSMLFKKETGLTLSEAILRTRLKVAMDLLRTTLEPVSLIASKAGYADVQYFSRVFKQFTGFTPLEYRRKALVC